MKALATVFFFLASAALADELPPDAQLPDWVRAEWMQLAKKRSLALSTKINPFLLRGDFDADGRGDLALLVEHVKSGKIGIAIVHRDGKAPTLLGAGAQFGNGGDNFDWLGIWHVQDKGAFARDPIATPVRLRGDALYLEKEGSASALVYFERGQYKWLQISD